MEQNQEYTVIVRGHEFLLDQSQIEFDSPNFFTACFLGDFNEAQSRTLRLSRDPELFQIILNYLCGYTVLPLRDDFAPAFMTHETVLTNLRADALFYQLDGLVQQCNAMIKQPVPGGWRGQYLVLGSQYKHAEIEDIDTQMTAAILSKGWKTRIDKDALQKEPFLSLERPDSRNGFAALRELAAVERFVVAQFEEYATGAWCLVGWNVRKIIGTWEVSSQLMVVLKQAGL
ncbi:unnamed protein product [Rhizoctonia solani]|uniref:BTB domain-containing protein n=1 Tax=Rhizoctonia solani TaxID=456999 RepID=A0A8H3I2D2_9AGAM|nr:unnamed protein product [Rhizoctonia solani]